MKTIQISDDVHFLITERRTQLLKNSIDKRMWEVADILIKAGIEATKDEDIKK